MLLRLTSKTHFHPRDTVFSTRTLMILLMGIMKSSPPKNKEMGFESCAPSVLWDTMGDLQYPYRTGNYLAELMWSSS